MDNTVAVAGEPAAPTQAAAEPQDTSDKGAFTFKDSTDMPLDVYQRENREDYILKMMNMEDHMDDLPVQEQESLKLISEHILNAMRNEGYEETTKAYRSMFQKISKQLGIDKNVSREAVLDRMTGYIEARKLISEIKKLNDDKLIKQVQKARNKKDMMGVVMQTISTMTGSF